MKTTILFIACLYGTMAISLGALGAHALKKILSRENVESFEVGVRYMIYHALFLLIVGFALNFENGLQKTAVWLVIVGCAFFSGSIFGLSFSEKVNVPTKILGPITPLGGMMMIIGWILLGISFAL